MFRLPQVCNWSACGLVLMMLGCANDEPATDTEPVAVTGDTPQMSFEAYVAKHLKRHPTRPGYLLEGDLFMKDMEAVKRYWTATSAKSGALSVRRYLSDLDVWNRTDRLNITYCIRKEFSDLGQYDRLSDFLHKGASAWENAANVRFVHLDYLDNTDDCNYDNTEVKYAVYYNPSLGWGSGMGFPSYGTDPNLPERFLELGTVETFPDYYFLGTIVHEFGHALGFIHEHDTNPAIPGMISECDMTAQSDWERATCYDSGSVMHYPDPSWPASMNGANIIRQRDIEGAQSIYEAPTNVLNTSSGTVYARKQSDGGIYQRNSSGTWTQIGGPGQAFVTVGNVLFGQTPGRGSPVRYAGGSTGWYYIGDPVATIFRCGAALCATARDSGDVLKYDITAGTWSWVGGAGARFQATTAGLMFGISPWMEYTAVDNGGWYVTGDGASELFGGGAYMYRLTRDMNWIQKYEGDWSWTTIGGAGRQFLATSSYLYGVSPNGGGIYRYMGTQWNLVHFATARMYGSYGYLFATSADGTIERYNVYSNSWTNLGKP